MGHGRLLYIASSSTALELHFGIEKYHKLWCQASESAVLCHAANVTQLDRQCATCQAWHDHIGFTNIEDFFTPQAFYVIKARGLSPWKDTQKIRWVWWKSLGCRRHWVPNNILWPCRAILLDIVQPCRLAWQTRFPEATTDNTSLYQVPFQSDTELSCVEKTAETHTIQLASHFVRAPTS